MPKKATFKCGACGAKHIITETDDGYEMELVTEPKPIEKKDDENGAGKDSGKKRESFLEFIDRLNKD